LAVLSCVDHAPETNDEPPSRGTLATQSSLIADVADPARGQRWDEFDRTYRGVVLGMARKAGLSHHDAEDVTQEVFTALVRSLVGFELGQRRGSFRRYLFQLVRWRVASKFDQLKRAGDDALASLDEPESVCADPQASAGLSPDHAEAEFRVAVVEAMRVLAQDLSPRDVQMLELYYCQEWPADRIAKALKMRPTSVYVVAHRHKLRLCREIYRRL
jgi:RNA polymerase sigma-70 factor (ECF subfamily)